MSDSVRPYRRQPTRLPHPWDSPGKNTGVGCHFLLQCMKAKSESEVTQSCPTLSYPMDYYSLPGSSVHGILQARVLEWGAIGLVRKKNTCYLLQSMAGFLSVSFPQLPQSVKVSLLNSSKTIPICSLNLFAARTLTDTLRQNQVIKSAVLRGK